MFVCGCVLLVCEYLIYPLSCSFFNEAGSYQCAIIDTLMMMTVRLLRGRFLHRDNVHIIVKCGEDGAKGVCEGDVCWCEGND